MGSELQARGKKAAASVNVASHRLAGKQEGCEWNCLDCEKSWHCWCWWIKSWWYGQLRMNSPKKVNESMEVCCCHPNWFPGFSHFQNHKWKQDATKMQDTGFTIQCLSASRCPLGQRDEEQWQWYPQDQILQPFACRLVVKLFRDPPGIPKSVRKGLYVWVNSRGNSGPVLDLVQDIFSIIYHPIVTGPEINVGLFTPFSEFVLIDSNYCGKLKRIGEKIETSDSLTGRDCQCRMVWNWPYASSHLFACPKILKTILRVVCQMAHQFVH